MRILLLALRSLRREWHLPELRTLAASLVLAVVALGVVATLSTRMERGVLASAAELIGGDLGVSAPQSIPDKFAVTGRQHGLEITNTAGFPSVAFAQQQSQLLDVLATDAAYPLRGTLLIGDANGRQIVGHGPAAGTVYLDHRALVALHRHVGDTVQLGGRDLRIAGELLQQPDGGELVAMAPRALETVWFRPPC